MGWEKILLAFFVAGAGFADTAIKGTLLGVIQYKGGYQDISTGPITSKDLHEWLEVKLPKYCSDVEVLRLSTFTEGVEDEATVSDSNPNLFRIANAPARIGKVRLMLNGPKATECAIPIFATTPDTELELVTNHHFRMCNEFRLTLDVTLAYQVDSQWRLSGKYRIPPGNCLIPETRGLLEGEIFSHATASNGAYWGEERTFCFPEKNDFHMTEAQCASMPNHSFKPYSPSRVNSSGPRLTLRFY